MLVVKNTSKMKEMMNTNMIKIPSIQGKILDKMPDGIADVNFTVGATERASKTNETIVNIPVLQPLKSGKFRPYVE